MRRGLLLGLGAAALLGLVATHNAEAAPVAGAAVVVNEAAPSVLAQDVYYYRGHRYRYHYHGMYFGHRYYRHHRWHYY
jgi:hypothetical protein